MKNLKEMRRLAAAMMALDYDAMLRKGTNGEVDTLLKEKYGVDITQFGEIAKDLVHFTPFEEGPEGLPVQGFFKYEDTGETIEVTPLYFEVYPENENKDNNPKNDEK